MLTNLTPCYSFTDTKGYLVGSYTGLTTGSEVSVYVPSLMPQITRSINEETTIESLGSASQIFVNVSGSMPNIPSSLTCKNFVKATLSSSRVIKEANDKLIADTITGVQTDFIKFIPNQVDLPAGTEVSVSGSDTGSATNFTVS